MADNLLQRIHFALHGIRHPRLGTDLIKADVVRDVATTTDGRVRLTLVLAADDDATLVRDVRQAVEGSPACPTCAST